MAGMKRSGSPLRTATAGFQSISAAMMTSSESAFRKKESATPEVTMMRPASVGPTARATLTPMEFRATAGFSASRGTRLGTIDWKIGADSAAQTPIRNVMASRPAASTQPASVIRPSSVASAALTSVMPISSRFLSKRSAMAPAGRAKRAIASVVAACTAETTKGDGERDVISQAAETSCIQVPMLDRSVAVHRSAKARCRRGAKAEGADAWAGTAVMMPVSLGPGAPSGLRSPSRRSRAHPRRRARPTPGQPSSRLWHARAHGRRMTRRSRRRPSRPARRYPPAGGRVHGGSATGSRHNA